MESKAFPIIAVRDYYELTNKDKTRYLEGLAKADTYLARVRSGSKGVARRLTHGLGINDAPYPIEATILDGVVRCPAYTTWSSMFSRCYSKAVHRVRPSYVGCCVHPEWYSFSSFRTWWLQQYIEGYQLDKDLLTLGNKMYSPSTCLFVPSWVNSFTIASNSNRGMLPLGVCVDYKQKTKPYHASCTDSSSGVRRKVWLGNYATPEEAHQAWLNYKLSIVQDRSAELEAIRTGLTDKVKAKVLSLV